MCAYRKDIRTVKLNPNDPDWKFPYASRARIEKLRAYFTSFPHNTSFRVNKNTFAIKDQKERVRLRKLSRWPSVPPEFRERTEAWFQKKVKQVIAERGSITPGKLQSLRMNAAGYGRWILTRRRWNNIFRYRIDKAMWLRYLDWEREQLEQATPRTVSKHLDIL